MKCNIIGAGRLGQNIALALSTSHIASLQAIHNRSVESANQACINIGAGFSIDKIELLPPADITWITCNDDTIEPTVSILKQNPILKPNSFVIHCSGVLNSSLLDPLKAQGCAIASFHPLKAFREGYLESNAFQNVDCVVEGDEKACAWLNQAFTSLGANIIAMKSEAKATYHAAASIASNYLITLAACSEELLLKAGISQDQARQMICKLMQGNLNNVQETQNIADSLTGPLMRGDINTLALHLHAIENPIIKELYKAAGLATLPLTHLSKEKKLSIEELLEK